MPVDMLKNIRVHGVCSPTSLRCIIIIMIQTCLIIQNRNPFLNGSVDIKFNIGSLLESIRIFLT